MMTRGASATCPWCSDHGELIGLISIGDVVKARLEEARHETEALQGLHRRPVDRPRASPGLIPCRSSCATIRRLRLIMRRFSAARPARCRVRVPSGLSKTRRLVSEKVDRQWNERDDCMLAKAPQFDDHGRRRPPRSGGGWPRPASGPRPMKLMDMAIPEPDQKAREAASRPEAERRAADIVRDLPRGGCHGRFNAPQPGRVDAAGAVAATALAAERLGAAARV